MPVKPRRRRTQVELLLEAAGRFAYRSCPRSSVVSGWRTVEGPAARFVRTWRRGEATAVDEGGEMDEMMLWAREWSAGVRRRRVERIRAAEDGGEDPCSSCVRCDERVARLARTGMSDPKLRF